jgi:TonB-linked SusC/RagA family outer membrane protein
LKALKIKLLNLLLDMIFTWMLFPVFLKVKWYNYRNGSTVDWYDKIVKSGITKNNNISISGKTEKTSYYFSGTFFNQSGIVKNDDFDRFTLKANFKNEITDWYTLSLRTGFTSLDYSGVAADLFYGYSPYGSYWEDESLNIYKPFPTEDFYKQHPMINTQIDNRDVSTSVLGTLSSQLKIPFIKGLKWTLNYSTNLRSRRIDNFWNNTLNIGSGTTLNGNASKQIVDNYDWTLDNIINYNRLFNKKHSVDITLLYSREYQRYEKTFAGANDFINQGLGYNNLSLGKSQQSDSDLQDQNSVAYMARLNYVYNNKYALTASIRRDGFSSFSKSHKYATFPSLALAWTASNEGFLETTSWLNTLKFRVSYGENGNQALGRYQTLSRIQNSQYLFGDGSDTEGTVFVESIANNDLGWETTKVVNFGMDFGFLQNRLRGTVDLYSSNTYNILLQRNIPATTGYSTVWTNLGKVHNKGIEFTLNSANISGDNLSWETGFVFSLNRNRIDELLGEDVDGDGKEDDIVANSWFIGSPLGVVFGYKTNGIYQTGEEAPSGFKAGDFRLVDNNDDGEITPDDRMILGTTLPNYVFSISNTFKYKNLSLYIMFNSIQGGGKDNSYIGNNMAMHNVNNPFPTWAERFNVQDVPYWTPENPSNDYPSINYVPTRNHPYLEDRSFVRLQDITISYNFDSSIFENLPINGLRTYVSGKNIYTWTKWTGYDPEIQTSIGDFPTLRTITMGLDVRF